MPEDELIKKIMKYAEDIREGEIIINIKDGKVIEIAAKENN